MSPTRRAIVEKCMRILQALAVSCSVYYGIFCETKYSGVIETARLTPEQKGVMATFKTMSRQNREAIANDILAINMALNDAEKSIKATKYIVALKEIADAEKLIKDIETYGIPLAKEKEQVAELKSDLEVMRQTA